MATLMSNSVMSTAYKITKTVTGVECDICKDVIPVKSLSHSNSEHRYFEVPTGHYDWGNDSCDSVETRDICPKCISKFIEEYLRDCSDTAHLQLHTYIVEDDEYSEVVDVPPKEGEVTRKEHDYY